MRITLPGSILGVLVMAGPAAALNQSEHAAITERVCLAAGFTDDFCRRAGDEAYNTDFAEFDVLAAHAQPDAGATACQAAGKSMQRLLALGQEVRAGLRRVKADPSNTDHSAA